MIKLTKTAKKTIAEFAAAAQDYGYQRDQGSREDAEASLKDYQNTLEALRKFVSKLQYPPSPRARRPRCI